MKGRKYNVKKRETSKDLAEERKTEILHKKLPNPGKPGQ